MAYEELDRRIERARANVESARQVADKRAEELQSAVSSYVVAWAKSELESTIGRKSEEIVALGDEKVAKFKSQYLDAITEVPALTVEQMDKVKRAYKADLPREFESSVMAGYDAERKGEQTVETVIRGLLGTFGEVLIAHGLDDISRWRRLEGGGLGYAYGIPGHGIPEFGQFTAAQKAYGEALHNYIKEAQSLREAEKAKARAQAKDMFDRAE